MTARPQFLFLTCQVGAETAAKNELARVFPAARPAYARPGFLTFKLPEHHFLPDDFDLHSVFARAIGFSLGKVNGEDPDALAQGVWKIAAGRDYRRLHVWERDRATPGEHGYEPSITAAAIDAAEHLRRHGPRPEMLDESAIDPKVPARPDEMVLDCILVQSDEWWVGYHQAREVASFWPGGMMPLELPAHAASRAYLKMEESLRWSQLPVPPGGKCVELGSAPGGASQALLDRGMVVLGIDPAEMPPAILAHPHFTHIRKRAVQVRRREFRDVRWLMADMNVAPGYTLDAVEAIVTHPSVNIRGMILTLKLFEWKLADEIPQYLDRVRGWGYNVVQARQLQHNRQEICVAALQKPFVEKALPGQRQS